MRPIRTEQVSLFDDNPEYDAFVEKFKPKKTTDDCYTPQPVYDAILEWARNEYSLEDRPIIRPFYPDGDYEAYPYPDGCVVVDNPPFSILSRIIEFYNRKKIDYFLFAPALTVFSTAKDNANSVIAKCDITYENGARVATAFVTNLGEYRIHVAGDLHRIVKDAMQGVLRETKSELPKYIYPAEVITSALIEKVAARGISLKIRPNECHFVRCLDCQKVAKKHIFGAGFLLSRKAAAEKAAAEKAAAEKAAAEKAAAEKTTAWVWPLSEKEKEIIRNLE